MKHEEVYLSWVQAQKEAPIDPAFADHVMDRIRLQRAPGGGRMAPWSRWAEQIGISTWTKAAALGIASLLGVGRILLTLHLLLFA